MAELKTYKIKLVENIKETPTVHILRWKPAPFKYKTAQYIMIQLKDENGKLIKRKPYSLSSSPNDDYLESCIKMIPDGFMSNYLGNLKIGSKLEIMGPFGFFLLDYPLKNDAIFLATGSGISALHGMIKYLFEMGTDKEVWLFFGNRTKDEIIYRKFYEDLANKNKNFHFIPVLSREDWDGKKGHIQDVMPKYIKDYGKHEYYVCGLYTMVNEVEKFLLQQGIDKNKIKHERFV